MRRLLVGLAVPIVVVALGRLTPATPMATVARAVDKFNRDIVAWKKANALGGPEQVHAACAVLAKDARGRSPLHSPVWFSHNLWSSYRKALKMVATAAVDCSASAASKEQIVEQDGRAFADGITEVLSVIAKAQGIEPQD